MHVLHLETGRRLYGGARQVLLLMAGLEAEGVKGTLVCPADSEVGPAAWELGLDVVTMPVGGDLDVTAVVRLGQVIRERRPDLVHAHSRRGADFFGGLAAVLAGLPAVLTRRVDNPDTPLVGALKYRAYDRIVAISGAVAAQLRAEGVPAAKIRRIPSAVDPAACQPTWTAERFRAEFGLEPGQRTCAVVAQLIPRKGHRLLLEAWPMVRNHCPDARLLLFGTGPLEAELKARPDLGATVIFAGYRPDLREYLGHVDLLLHPALREGLGVSLLEAQAAGVPVVGFLAGGVPEAVVDGTTGVLVDPGNGAALAEAASRLLDQPNLRARLGAAGRARVAARFSPGAMTAAYLSLYRELSP